MTVGAALVLVLGRRLMSSAFLLLLVLLGVALLYGWQGALFPAVAQILVYVGGILILILFGLLLTQRHDGQSVDSELSAPVPALVLSLVVFFVLVKVWMALPADLLPVELPEPDGPRRIGVQLLTSYLVPFELISVLLLVALLGAAQLARPEKRA